ncbi:MAG: hypothetical protein COA67_02670 [Lutibacter sp.]|nr:MAG: hypothetical protein COA67_02670 [Lutibacter sp.]
MLLFTLISCSSDDNDKQTFTPTLPAITQTGANTFGCYIDGKLVTPRDGSGGIYGTAKGIVYSGSGTPPNYAYNEIRIQDYKGETGGIVKIHITDLHQNGEGTFTIKESNCEDGIDANPTINIHCRIIDEASQTYKWYCSIENAGTLTITRYDFDGRIISGTFNCTMQNNDDSSDTIEITQGRFDMKWDTLDETEFP